MADQNLKDLVERALDNSKANGYCVISDKPRSVAIDLLVYDADIEALMGAPTEGAISEVQGRVEGWQRRMRKL